ncbi:MAG: hypothetical protein RL885_12015 [Planctomycetota bacterium]
MRLVAILSILLTAGILCAWAALAQDAASLVTKPKKPCQIEEHRQFDFWIGDWEVFSPNGQRAGTNRIEAKLGGCVLHEHWSGNGGSIGESFNMYDGTRGVWHQTWVDNQGTLLTLEGGLKDGAMVLEGETVSGGDTVHHRVTWTPNADESVRQHWQSSKDGKTWTTSFDGKYVRREK